MSEIQNITSGTVVEIPSEKQLSLVCPSAKYGGYLYIILFENGVLKAGRTQKPAKRIPNHASNAASFSTTIEKVWVSCHHDNYTSNETLLMSRIAANAKKQNKREYFEGISFDDAVALASKLSFAAVDFDAHEARTAESIERLNGFLHRTWGDPGPEPANQMMAWGAPIRKMFEQVKLIGELDASDSDPEAMAELWASTASAMGKSYEEVMAMSHLDLLEHLANAFVRTAYLDAKIWAMKTGRQDLLESMGERYAS